MKTLHKRLAALRIRKIRAWAELSDWALAFIGGPSFLIGSYYIWVVGNVMPELLNASRDHGLPFTAILAFVFLGGLALSSLFFLSVARRCYELIYERNFK